MQPPTFERFRIVGEIGAGAMSTVYKAVEEPLGRWVALKVLKSTISPSSPFAAPLEREALILADLSHTNISVLHGFVKDERRMYLVLEYVDGFSLADVLAKVTALEPEVVAAIGIEVLRGLAYAHERGVVHRDVKPANILLSRRGDVKLADFGIAQQRRLPDALASARATAEPVTPLGDTPASGTPAYMSPEQILGETVDARSDVFSLGVVLYQCLSGARPFEKEGVEKDRMSAMQRIRQGPPVPLHRRAPAVPRALERIVMRAVEKLPVDRFASAADMESALADFVASRTSAPSSALVRRALVKAGLDAEKDAPDVVVDSAHEARRSIRSAVLGLAALGAVAMALGGIIQYTGRTGAHRVAAGTRPLELLPARAGGLRVLATPWAEVWVDGELVDTTPFARPIPLAAGTHYVTLKHPSAPPEKRTVTIVAGETITLDVTMDVAAPAAAPAPADAGPADAARDAEPRGGREKEL